MSPVFVPDRGRVDNIMKCCSGSGHFQIQVILGGLRIIGPEDPTEDPTDVGLVKW